MTAYRSEVFRLAWTWAKQDLWSNRAPAALLRSYFRAALVKSWAECKRRAAQRADRAAARLRSVEEVRAEMVALENTETLGWRGINRLAEVRAELAEAREAARVAATLTDGQPKSLLVSNTANRAPQSLNLAIVRQAGQREAQQAFRVA